MSDRESADVVVHVLGCGDAFSSGGRFHTSFLLRCGEESVLMDCGASAFTALKKADLAPDSISTILVSHLHGDHFGGLPFFLLDAHLVTKRQAPLTLVGPPGFETRLQAAMEVLFPGTSKIETRFALRFHELAPRQPLALAPLTVTAYPVLHPSGAPSYALRVEMGGRVIAFSGDTEWQDSLLEAAADADLFLCECYAFDQSVPYHIDYRTLMTHHPTLTCRRIMLTHLGEAMLGQLAQVELETAVDGMVIALGGGR